MRAPILSRVGLYRRLNDGSLVFLDWNLVDTPVGGMLEPRQMRVLTDADVNSVTIDARDALAYTRFEEVDEHVLMSQFATGGSPLPTTFER